jgi:hypothetical protein
MAATHAEAVYTGSSTIPNGLEFLRDVKARAVALPGRRQHQDPLGDYQWLIVHQFLLVTVGTWRNDPFIPVEFSVAAYRFGHSQVRPSYRTNFGTSATDPALQFSR